MGYQVQHNILLKIPGKRQIGMTTNSSLRRFVYEFLTRSHSCLCFNCNLPSAQRIKLTMSLGIRTLSIKRCVMIPQGIKPSILFIKENNPPPPWLLSIFTSLISLKNVCICTSRPDQRCIPLFVYNWVIH